MQMTFIKMIIRIIMKKRLQLNKEQSMSVKNRIKVIDEDIAVINKALGRWKEQ